MSQPLVVSIPHRLGKDEALRRLKSGFSQARTNFSGVMSMSEETWNGDQVSFRIGVMGQQAQGTVDVGESDVRVAVELPWLLARIADKIAPLIQRETQLMLDKK
jgi:hypothetical protein